jgi:hypothetical protein
MLESKMNLPVLEVIRPASSEIPTTLQNIPEWTLAEVEYGSIGLPYVGFRVGESAYSLATGKPPVERCCASYYTVKKILGTIICTKEVSKQQHRQYDMPPPSPAIP